MTTAPDRLPLTKATLTHAWRAAKLPRLYWYPYPRNWRWDSGEIARWRDGASVTHYYSMGAIRDEIERMK